MASLSTFSEMHLGLLAFIRSTLTLSYSGLFTSNNQIVFSPADDEESDFRRLEEVRSGLKDVENQIVFPSVVVSFNSVDDVWRMKSGRLNWGVTATTSSVGGSKGAPISCYYNIKAYCKTFEDCLLLSELFLLYLPDIRKISYSSLLVPGQTFGLQLEYDPAQVTRIATVGDRWGGKGHIYVASVKVKTSGVILLTTQNIFKRILKTSQAPFHIGIDANTSYEYVPPDYHDMLNDSIILEDTLEQG